MLTAILTLASLVLSGAFSHGKSAQKVQTMDLSLDESAGEGCSSFWDRCGGGLSCSTTTKTCVPYATRNEACGDSAGGIDCVDNYWCLLGIGSGYTCSSGAQGDACSKQNFPHSCNGDLSCLSNGMCGTNVGPGDACGSSAGNVDCVAGYWCSEGIGSGLTCSSGKEGEACSTGGESCNSGLSCLSKGYCGKDAGPKEACGSSAGNVDCVAGYWCSKGIGSGYTCSSGEKGEACSYFGESCKSGLSCLSDGMCGFKNAIGNGEYQSCCIYWAKNDNFCTNAAGVKASDSDQVCGCESDFMTFVLKCNAANCTTTKASTSGKKCTYNSTLPYVKESKESDWDKGWDEVKAVATGIWEGADSVAVGLFDSIKEVGECVWDVESYQISGTDACDKLGKQLKDMVVDVGKCWLTTFDPVSGLANPLKPIDECPLYKDLAKAWTNCLDDSNPTTCISKYTTIVALQVALAVGTAGTGVAAETTGDAVVASEEAGTVGTDGTDIDDKPEAEKSGCHRRHRLLLACKDAGCRAEVRRAHRKLGDNELTCGKPKSVLQTAMAQIDNNIEDLSDSKPGELFDGLDKNRAKSYTSFYASVSESAQNENGVVSVEGDNAAAGSDAAKPANDELAGKSFVFEMPLSSKDLNVDEIFQMFEDHDRDVDGGFGKIYRVPGSGDSFLLVDHDADAAADADAVVKRRWVCLSFSHYFQDFLEWLRKFPGTGTVVKKSEML